MEWTDGMLYPVLHRLERLGHVEARWEVATSGRRRKYYRITSAGPRPARRGAQAVAGGRRDAAGHLAGALPFPTSQPGVSRADARERLSDAGPRPRGLARGADRPVAELPPPPAGDPLRRRGGARRPSARAGRGAGRGRARHRRSVPGRGEAHGRPRRPLAGVRARALGPPLEAARRVPSDSTASRGRGGPNGRHRRLRSRRGGGGGRQGAGALRPRPGRRRRLLRPQREPLRAAPADRLFRLETAARHRARSAGWPRRSSRRASSPTSIPSTRRLHRGAHGAAPADRALAGGGHRVRRRPLEPGRGPHGLHPLLGRAVHLLRADRPRRRRPHGVHGDDLQGHRDRRRAVLRVVAAAVRSGRGRRWSPPGWWRPSKA